MKLHEKLANAKPADWLQEGLSESEIKTTVELAKISAKIERCRLDLKMTQSEFAQYMGVSQGMVSKWESRDYNFTIRSLNEICSKLNLSFSVLIEDKYPVLDYNTQEWNSQCVSENMQNAPLYK